MDQALSAVVDVPCAVVAQSDIAEPVVQYVKFADGPDTLYVSLDRNAWPDIDNIVTVLLDLSLDGGATWASDGDRQKPWPWIGYPRGFIARGGDAIDPSDKSGKLIATVSAMPFPLPDVKNPARVIRITITPAASLNTRADVTVSVQQ